MRWLEVTQALMTTLSLAGPGEITPVDIQQAITQTPPARIEACGTYIVKPGDTLGGIRLRYAGSEEQWLDVNPQLVDEHTLMVGADLSIPCNRLPLPGERTASTVFDRPGVVYQVEEETLSEIGEHCLPNPVSAEEIATWNGIPDPDFIILGQELILPPGCTSVEEFTAFAEHELQITGMIFVPDDRRLEYYEAPLVGGSLSAYMQPWQEFCAAEEPFLEMTFPLSRNQQYGNCTLTASLEL